jgi:tetratricopeptide (TPR) repeat protein
VGGWVELSHDRLIQALLRGGPIKRGDERSDPADYLRAAELALSEGQFGLAAKHAEEALRHSGTEGGLQAEIESFLGNINDLAGNVDESISHYQAAVELFASLRGTDGAIATLLTAIAQLRIRQGDVAAALRELRAAVRHNPTDLGIQTSLAWALWHSGRPTAALDVLDNALNLEGNTAEALRARGEMYADLGEGGQAARDLKRTMPHYLPSTQAAYALALALNGNVAEAMRFIPSTDKEQDASILLRVARVLAAADQSEKAAQLANRARLPTARPPLPPHLKTLPMD